MACSSGFTALDAQLRKRDTATGQQKCKKAFDWRMAQELIVLYFQVKGRSDIQALLQDSKSYAQDHQDHDVTV